MIQVSRKISEFLISDGYIEDNEKEIIEFGIHQGLSLSINIIIFIGISMLFGLVWQGIFFLSIFWPLRIYAGGYHARTEGRCYIISSMATFVVLCGANYTQLRKEIILCMVFVEVIVIFLLAPQGNENKKLEKKEYFIYKNKVKKILALHIVIFIVAYYLNINAMLENIFFSMTLMVILLIMGYLKLNKGKSRIRSM